MELPMNFVDKLIKEGFSQRFDNSFVYDNEKYHYFVNNNLFLTQVYRVYSLLAKEVGINATEYNYVRKEGINLLYAKSVCDRDEKLIESNFLDENVEKNGYYDYIKLWLDVMEKLPFRDKESSLDDFYKQWFFALSIFDDDKQISLIKDNKGLYRVGAYFDYGGVYMNQDIYEIDNDIFYDEEAYLEFYNECGYTREKMSSDLEKLIHKNVIEDIYWKDQNEDVLVEILPHLDQNFIEKCFSINIIDVMDKDKEHNYSANFRKVVCCMVETSRKLLREKIYNLNEVKNIAKRKV